MARNKSNLKTPTGRWLLVTWSIVTFLGLVLTAVTLLLATGALFDPTSNLFTFVSSTIWTTYAPHLNLLSLVSLMVGVVGLRYGPRRLAIVASVVAGITLLASIAITTQIVQAIHAAGGSASPITGLWLSSMNAAPPDVHETYTTAEGQPLQALIYRPAGANDAAPVMLYIHGGGWISGNADDIASDLRWFANQGWLVVSVKYRLATASEATWDKAPQDVACALVWIEQNAPRFGGDPERIAVLGDSAGGNLAVNLAYAAALGQAQSGCGGQVPIPPAVVVQYPAVDPQDSYDHGYPMPGFEPQIFVSRYIGGTPQELSDRVQAISSATYVSAQAPPTLVIEPEKDGLVPSAGVFHFVEQARVAGVDITLVRIPFANHIYNQMAANSIGDQGRLSITQHYLEQRGLIRNER